QGFFLKANTMAANQVQAFRGTLAALSWNFSTCPGSWSAAMFCFKVVQLLETMMTRTPGRQFRRSEVRLGLTVLVRRPVRLRCYCRPRGPIRGVRYINFLPESTAATS